VRCRPGKVPGRAVSAVKRSFRRFCRVFYVASPQVNRRLSHGTCPNRQTRPWMPSPAASWALASAATTMRRTEDGRPAYFRCGRCHCRRLLIRSVCQEQLAMPVTARVSHRRSEMKSSIHSATMGQAATRAELASGTDQNSDFALAWSVSGRDRPGGWLQCAAGGLCVLAAAAAAVSFTAQYRFVYAARWLPLIAGLEAAIPDAAALVFACSGVGAGPARPPRHPGPGAERGLGRRQDSEPSRAPGGSRPPWTATPPSPPLGIVESKAIRVISHRVAFEMSARPGIKGRRTLRASITAGPGDGPAFRVSAVPEVP
jgi:hypothetical protein